VSPCASGLSGPEGLVFGPGGALLKTVLYVAESTANRIAKVTPSCSVTPFATGLSSPTGLGISPGPIFGALDTTLYVTNATTRLDRVDTNGNITTFASGFAKADTIQFDPGLPLGGRMEGSVAVSDAQAGTIYHIYPGRFAADPQLAGCNPCRAGIPLPLVSLFATTAR
jgi:sugar lactone lactonase YvrE